MTSHNHTISTKVTQRIRKTMFAHTYTAEAVKAPRLWALGCCWNESVNQRKEILQQWWSEDYGYEISATEKLGVEKVKLFQVLNSHLDLNVW